MGLSLGLRHDRKTQSGAKLMATAVVQLIFSIFAYAYDLKERSLRTREIDAFLTSVGVATAWGVENWLTARMRLAESAA